ncbi:MAG: glycosyltransferase [Chloroflexi bacterium]|nr:glycosyltransferase [Chloroflexota bacterium]MBU1748912.1 glycosyltransferase [Chloroflexota bacterium]MBU1877508.1 glycosyltransferase [Chloroflexota bacterium]
MNNLHVSVIATVLNEGPAMTRLMDSLAAQTRLPDEVVIVDGGSTDDTVAVIRRYEDRLPLRVIVDEGADNISKGRNRAIAATSGGPGGGATGDIIAATDAGVRLSPDWLAELVAPFEEIDPPDVVCGFFLPDPQTTFEVAMGATVLPAESDIDPATFLPSSRSVAFRKAAWARWPYPEWLDYCEDLIFDLGLKEHGERFVFAPGAVAWFRPRGSVRAFWKQYWQYARGDGKADLWRKRHAIRYLTYLVATPVLLLAGWFIHPLVWLLLPVGFAAYVWTPVRRLWPHLSAAPCGRDLPPIERLKALAWVPVIRVAGDWAKMGGYPVGWWWRLQNRGRPEVHWQRDVKRQVRDSDDQ